MLIVYFLIMRKFWEKKIEIRNKVNSILMEWWILESDIKSNVKLSVCYIV